MIVTRYCLQNTLWQMYDNREVFVSYEFSKQNLKKKLVANLSKQFAITKKTKRIQPYQLKLDTFLTSYEKSKDIVILGLWLLKNIP